MGSLSVPADGLAGAPPPPRGTAQATALPGTPKPTAHEGGIGQRHFHKHFLITVLLIHSVGTVSAVEQGEPGAHMQAHSFSRIIYSSMFGFELNEGDWPVGVIANSLTLLDWLRPPLGTRPPSEASCSGRKDCHMTRDSSSSNLSFCRADTCVSGSAPPPPHPRPWATCVEVRTAGLPVAQRLSRKHASSPRHRGQPASDMVSAHHSATSTPVARRRTAGGNPGRWIWRLRLHCWCPNITEGDSESVS